MNEFFRLLILALLALSFAAQAEVVRGSPNEIFRPLSKKIPQAIIDQGIKKIGDLDVAKLIAKLDTVEWRTFDLGFLSGSGGKRQTSIYIVKDRMVVVNMLALQNLVEKPVRIDRWALHEALGALGYDDENYEITTALTFVSPADKGLERVDLVERTLSNLQIRTTDHVYDNVGGTTIIGGGGDAPIIELKTRLLERYDAWVELHRPGLNPSQKKKGLRRLIDQSIEFSMDSSHNSVEFQMKDGTLWIDDGGNIDPSKMYGEEFLDSVLQILSPILFK